MKGDKELTEVASNISSEALRQRAIEQCNRIITEFMDGKLMEGKKGNVYWFENGHHIYPQHKALNISVFKYHSSWDWLMHVWIKFKNLDMKGVSTSHFHKQVCTSFANGILSGDIANAWSDAVMAIKWYNHGKLP